MLAQLRTGAARLALAVALGAVPSAAHAGASLDSLFETDFADPFVLRDGLTYYAFATGANGRNVQVARSRDLLSWTRLTDALPQLPSWAAPGPGLTWAPSVLRRGDRWVLYYTTADTGSGFQCISRAIASRPEGPYVDDSLRPFVCQAGGATPFCGSIDPSPFVDADGRAWLLFKSDENAPTCRSRPRIWSQQLSDDGLSVIGAPNALLATDQVWEGPLIEGPSMTRAGDHTLLFYSANCYESRDYAVGYAVCEGPAGPCSKRTTDAPLLKSTERVIGPGGQEIFSDILGRPWVAYHAWTTAKTSYAAGGMRALRLAPLDIRDGSPTITP